MKYCTEDSAKHVQLQYKKIITQFSCAQVHETAW